MDIASIGTRKPLWIPTVLTLHSMVMSSRKPLSILTLHLWQYLTMQLLWEQTHYHLSLYVCAMRGNSKAMQSRGFSQVMLSILLNFTTSENFLALFFFFSSFFLFSRKPQNCKWSQLWYGHLEQQLCSAPLTPMKDCLRWTLMVIEICLKAFLVSMQWK